MPSGLFPLLLVASLLAAACGPAEKPPAGKASAPSMPTVRQRDARTFTLVAAGDILLDRGVGRKVEKHGNGYVFGEVQGLIRQADLAVANLEGSVSKDGKRTPKLYCFKAAPAVAACLPQAGFDALSLNNNHTLDCYQDGLRDTLEALQKMGVASFGAGLTSALAAQPRLVTVRTLKVAMLGFCDISPDCPAIREGQPTVNFASEEGVRRAVGTARKVADVVIASFHWGNEDTHQVITRQKALARAAAESGADLVLGHHPHVLQGFEVIAPKDKSRHPVLVAYSLGNFAFDQHREMQQESLILRCTLDRAGVLSAEIIPIRILGFRPVPAGQAEASETLERLARWSKALGTTLDGAKIRMERGQV